MVLQLRCLQLLMVRCCDSARNHIWWASLSHNEFRRVFSVILISVGSKKLNRCDHVRTAVYGLPFTTWTQKEELTQTHSAFPEQQHSFSDWCLWLCQKQLTKKHWYSMWFTLIYLCDSHCWSLYSWTVLAYWHLQGEVRLYHAIATICFWIFQLLGWNPLFYL